MVSVELDNSLQAHHTKIPCLNLQFMNQFRSIDLGGKRRGSDGGDDHVGNSRIGERSISS